MTSRLQRLLESLDKRDFEVLRVIERYMYRFEYVPVELIEKRSRLKPGELLKSIDKLSTLKLVKRRLGSVTGYTLTYTALDLLALANLVSRGVISRIGDRIGVGKESDVYIAETPTGDLVVVKFHREGRTSFTHLRRHRAYVARVDRVGWLRIAKLVGEREFKALLSLHREKARVPEPIAYNRHCVVQEYIPGIDLYRVKQLDEATAKKTLLEILESLRIAYLRVGIVHGDLSEYNIMITDEGEAYIIDWPQYVYREDETAESLLNRDVNYIIRFYKRRYGIGVEPDRALRYIKGEINAI
ncbi:MAG: AarF/UbiB family protein [Desulfurococcales archaeon]|nr:AarF/UbiB family protein [Desulfurococcales archaeon]MEB3779888.1 AarF/UbiB family protein [Desulfurococcales archaeon]